MQKSKIFITALLATTTLSTMFPQNVAFAAEKGNATDGYDMGLEQQSARYIILTRVTFSASISDSGALFSLNVSGMSEVNEISGQVTLYKKDTSGNYYEVSSESFREDSRLLIRKISLPTDGPGTYRLEVEGTAYTADDSEDFSKSIIKSY